jgi:hypothetical protein
LRSRRKVKPKLPPKKPGYNVGKARPAQRRGAELFEMVSLADFSLGHWKLPGSLQPFHPPPRSHVLFTIF